MKQQSFGDYEYSCRKKKTKREEFLDVMEEIIPWDEWVEFVRPYYPSGKRSRPVKGIEKMLRMYLLQVWFNLSDEGIEDAIYDRYAFRKFMGINFVDEQVPDATTLLKFRHLLEKNHIGEQLFNAINYVLNQGGAMMKGGTIVDATIINAPSSTKNAEKARDPEMHQTKKGNEAAFLDYYDEVEICEESARAHFKAAIQIRNRCMVDRSDLVVCCIQHQSGGAYRTVQYAQRLGKRVVEVG